MFSHDAAHMQCSQVSRKFLKVDKVSRNKIRCLATLDSCVYGFEVQVTKDEKFHFYKTNNMASCIHSRLRCVFGIHHVCSESLFCCLLRENGVQLQTRVGLTNVLPFQNPYPRKSRRSPDPRSTPLDQILNGHKWLISWFIRI